MYKLVAVSSGSGLMSGAVADVLPTFQLVCFVVGLTLLNLGYLKR
ncbi:hypothetical protein [Vibrio fluvialis]|nr:hypothetical protein [Vibrio fluvialis]